MTTNHDVAGVVERLRGRALATDFSTGDQLCARAADLIESQANALNEAEVEVERVKVRCAQTSNSYLARALAAEARLAGAMKVIEPFVDMRDQFPQSTKVTLKKLNGFAPVQITVTKDQFKAALAFLAAEQEKA